MFTPTHLYSYESSENHNTVLLSVGAKCTNLDAVSLIRVVLYPLSEILQTMDASRDHDRVLIVRVTRVTHGTEVSFLVSQC